MKNTSVVLLAVLALAFSALAEAAKPRKRTRNADRVGPYAVGFLGQTTYSSESINDELFAVDILISLGSIDARNVSVSTQDSNLGYQAAFGYRFNRYIAAELSLLQLGEKVSTARGELDFGGGFVPGKVNNTFKAGGPLFSAIGTLPLNNRLELFGRVGYLFAASRRELTARIDDDSGGLGSGTGDSQDLILGAGAAVHFGQVYSVRFEYLRLGEIGAGSSGGEEADMYGLGIVVRF
jgi:opacity protein-like surface antigen